MSSPLPCPACGAPRVPGRATCPACGTPVPGVDAIAAPTFDGPGGWRRWEHPPAAVRVVASGARLQITVAPAASHGGQTAVAWLGGAFVDHELAVTVRFPGPPVGAAAGAWLRSAGGDAVLVLLWDHGRITVSTHRDHVHHASLAALDPPTWAPGTPVRLGAALRGPRLTVRRDGVVVGTFTVERVASGDVELRVQGGAGPAEVELTDPVATV